LFSHYERRGKCEWFGGGLAEFVSQYNRDCGMGYSLTECLDIGRVGGATPKKPEVLVTDVATGKQMVIERKSVVWPPKYILIHKNGHDFAETIGELTRGMFHGLCYQLTVSAKQLEPLDNRRTIEIARDISSAIVHLTPSDLPVRRSVPINWVFRRASVHEHGERKGIVVVHEGGSIFDRILNDSARKGTAAAIQAALAAASAKFNEYPDARRVVLLDFYGDGLFEDDIPPVLKSLAIPPNVDEIWMTKPDWISEDDFEIGYEQLFVNRAYSTGAQS
jgi:hypothetical protein